MSHIEMYGIESLLAATSAVCAVLAIAWPKLTKNQLAVRIQSIEGEREKSAADRTVPRQSKEAGAELVAKPRHILNKIFEAMHLDRQAENGEVGKKLRMAGFRSKAAVTNFLAFRFIVPFITFVVCCGYFPVVFGDRVPFAAALIIAVVAGTFAWFAPEIFIRNRIGKRQFAISRAWPDALDLLLISIEAGMSVESAFRKATTDMERQSKELAEELSITTAELSYLQDRKTAFHHLAERTGLEDVKAVVTVLVQGERYGTSLGDSLRILAKESRARRMRAAEKKAAALPPKLTIPMIIFFLPILFTVIITPALIRALGWQ